MSSAIIYLVREKIPALGPRGPRAGMDSAVSPETSPIIPAEAILTVCPSSVLPSPASSASG